MAGGYRHDPDGPEGVAAKIRELQRQINELRSAAGIKSAVIGQGGLTVYSEDDPNIRAFLGAADLWFSDLSRTTQKPGRVTTNKDWDTLFIFPPETGWTGEQTRNSIQIMGHRGGANGNIYLQTDGALMLRTRNQDGDASGQVYIDTPQLALYSLPTTGSSANLRLDTIGGVWTVGYISSSLRYKQDVEDAEVNPREVIQLTAKTWRDRNEVEHDPDTTKRNVGFIAEELDEHPTLRQFVDYDDEGRPDAIQYDRLSVALLAVIKEQDERLAAVEARLDALESKES